MQFINRGPSLGGMWGEALGEGLGQGLQALANYKLQQVQQRQTENALTPIFGSETAKALSYLHGPEFGYALRYLSGGRGYAAGGKQQQSGLGQLSYDQNQADYLTGTQPKQVQQQVPTSTPEEITSMAKKFAPAIAAGTIGNKPIAQPQAQAATQKQATMQQLAGQPTPQMPVGTEAIKLTPELITKQGLQNIGKVGLVSPVKKTGPLTVKDLQRLKQQPAQQPIMSPSAAPTIEQPVQGRPAPTAKTIQEGYKANKTYIDELDKKASVAAQNKAIFKRMETLNNSGKIMNRYVATGLGLVSEDLRKAFSNKATQEFEKLAKQYVVRSTKPLFGGRPAAFDVKQLLDTVPNLSQSVEGRAQVLKACMYLEDLTELEMETKKNIIKSNGGVPPLNLRERVIDEMAPKQAQLDQEFISGGNEGGEYKIGEEYENDKGERAIWNGTKMVSVGKGR